MRVPLLLGLVALAMLPAADPARGQGMPGATVGLPMGSPDPFGHSTVNRPSRYGTEPLAEPSPEPSPERRMAPGQRRLAPGTHRRLESYRKAGPKRRAPVARR